MYVVRSIGSDKDQYLVTDGNGKWAHGDTVKEAKDDLIYKISNRDKSKCEGWTTQTEVSFEEAIEAYRAITGACAAGTKGFVERMNPRAAQRPLHGGRDHRADEGSVWPRGVQGVLRQINR